MIAPLTEGSPDQPAAIKSSYLSKPKHPGLKRSSQALKGLAGKDVKSKWARGGLGSCFDS